MSLPYIARNSIAIGTGRRDRILPWLTNLLPETHLAEIGRRNGSAAFRLTALLAIVGEFRKARTSSPAVSMVLVGVMKTEVSGSTNFFCPVMTWL